MATRPATARVLILTADVGDGHVAAGRALGEHLAARYDVDADVRDGLALLGPAAQRIIRDGYRRQLAVAPWAFNLSYQACRSVRPLQAAGGRLLYLAGRRRLGEFVRDHPADVVVSTHPALTAALGRMRLNGELDAALCALDGADVLVHGTGGMTSHEALACGCPLIGYGTALSHVHEHYRALARLGLCRVAKDRAALQAMLRGRATVAALPRILERCSEQWLAPVSL